MLTIKEILKKISWSSISAVVFIILQSLVLLFLAHTLDAKVLGEFSLSISLILFFINILENGIPNSIINTPNPQTEDYNAVLSINLIIALLGTVTIFLSIAILNYFIPDNDFSKYTLALIPTLFLTVYNKTQLVGLQKTLQFKNIAHIEIISNLAYIISIIICIIFKMGIWILVISYLIKIAATTIFLVIRHHHYSNNFFQLNTYKIKEHWTYGKFITSEKIISSIITYADTFIVSFSLGLATLGIYDIFKRIVIRPIVILYTGAEQVFFPLFAKFRDDDKSFLSAYQDLNFISKHFFISITCLLYVNSGLIMSLLPESYQSFIDSYKLLCLFAATIIIVNPIDIILYSLGRSKEFFFWILSYSLPLLLVIFGSSQMSLSYLVISLSLFYTFLYVISYFVLIKKTTIPFLQYFSVLTFALCYYFVILTVDFTFGINKFISLLISLIILCISSIQFYRKFL